MAYKKTISVIFLLVVAIGAIVASDLLEVETTHFTIIYDESCQESAALIANTCEDTYDYLCSLFGVDPALHLPVILTTKTKMLNAYFTPSPANHIVLYDVVADKGSLTSFSETLPSIFKHELTHAFTMNLRSSFWQGLANIFGDYINPSNFLYSYQSMTEGIAVATESLEGYGRMNDLYSYRIVYQAKLEGKFPSWIEICGARDTYPSSLLPYIFGGAFLTYLCDTYGTDAVYEIFVEFGKINWFKDTAKIIETTIGVKFNTLWEDFYQSIEVPDSLVESSKLASYAKLGSFNGLKALSDGSVVFHDSASYSLYSLGANLEKSSKVCDFLSYADEYSVLEDGTKFLLPFVLESSNYVKIVTKEGKLLKTFNFDDRDVRGGVFTDDGILLYVSKGQDTFLELYNNDYEQVASLALGYGAVASSFTNCKDGRIAFIYTLNAQDNIALLDIQSMKIELYENPIAMRIFSLALAYGTEESLLSFTWLPEASSLNGSLSGQDNDVNNSPILGGYGEFILDDGGFRLSKVNVNGGVNSPLRLKDTVLFSSNLYEGALLNTISIEALELEEKSLTSCFELEVQSFDSSKLNALNNAKKYKVFENMTNGFLLPYGSYLDVANGNGMTWSVTDPTGKYVFNMSGFFDNAGIFSLGVWGTDNIEIGSFAIPVSVGTKLTNGSLHFNFQVQPYYAYYFDAGKQLEVTDIISECVILSNKDLANSFHNLFAISYSSFTSTGLGLNKTKGYKVQFALEDIDPSLSVKVKFPVFKFGISLSSAAKYEFKAKTLDLLGSANVNWFNFEIHDGIRIVSLYIKRISVDTQYECSYQVATASFEQVIQLRLYATLAPLFGALSSSVEVKFGAILSWNPAEGRPKISFSLIK